MLYSIVIVPFTFFSPQAYFKLTILLPQLSESLGLQACTIACFVTYDLDVL